eukprot:1538459-Heterocapsa_arctica.AAC.1
MAAASTSRMATTSSSCRSCQATSALAFGAPPRRLVSPLSATRRLVLWTPSSPTSPCGHASRECPWA